jgi:hypothetical protein
MARVEQMHKRQSIDDFGELLLHEDKPVGVLIKIHHQSPLTHQSIVNLSSWYVEPDYRWYAPRMLMKATSQKDIIYTDFTPSPDVFNMNERLGFKTIARSDLLFPLPMTALLPATTAKIRAVDDVNSPEISEDMHQFMQLHNAGNNAALYIDDGEQLHPIIFQFRKRRGIPCAKLIYADDIELLHMHCVKISRYLLRKGVVVMTMPSSQNRPVRGAFLLNKSARHQVKGNWKQNMVDQTFSETILLPYHT